MDYQIQYDITGLTQTQINHIKALAVAVLFAAGVTYDEIDCVDGLLTVVNASQDPTPIATRDALIAQWQIEEAARAAAEAAAEAAAAEDAQRRALIERLTALKAEFVTACGGALSGEEIDGWLTTIDGTDAWAKWRTYERHSSLLLVEALVYVLKRL